MNKSKCRSCGFEWNTGTDGNHSCAKILQERIDEAIDIAVRYGGFGNPDKKAWVIDQIVRILAKDNYSEVIRKACDGQDGPDTYYWETGIAP